MRVVVFLVLSFGAVANAQYYPQQPGMGFPVPSWLKGSRTVTGHIGGIEADRILVRTLDQGNILCHVDDKTKVHVDKTPLTLKDLRDGDAVAVKIKDVKGQGPYAQEIMPHPDVLHRKENGGTPDPPPAATPLPESQLPPVQRETRLEAPPASASETAPPSSTAATSSAPLTVPALPRGQHGIQGTIVSLNNDEALLQMENGEKRAVLVTTVTRIVRAGTRDEILEEVRVGDRVAIIGDSLDSGVYVAREVLVNRAVEQLSRVASETPAAQEGCATGCGQPKKSAPLSGTFTGIIESVAAESMQVRADGQLRTVTVTPITTIKKWNSDTPLAGLRKGDEVKIVGDVLDESNTLAREVTVTKAAPSR